MYEVIQLNYPVQLIELNTFYMKDIFKYVLKICFLKYYRSHWGTSRLSVISFICLLCTFKNITKYFLGTVVDDVVCMGSFKFSEIVIKNVQSDLEIVGDWYTKWYVEICGDRCRHRQQSTINSRNKNFHVELTTNHKFPKRKFQ